jgi:two-component system sensor histidine kinase/response regulator
MKTPKVLIIDDEAAICDACSQVLCKEGYEVVTCSEGKTGLEKFDEISPDIVFVDLKMPGVSGHQVLEAIRQRDRDVVQIVITGYATVESAVASMKNGAYDFLPKPFTPDELKIIANRALEKRMGMLQARRLQAEKDKMRNNFHFMVSHELKTPLAAVMQYLEVLTQGVTGSLSEEQAKIIERMKIRTSELISLIDRWLQLSVLEDINVRQNFREFDLCQVIDDVIEFLRPIARDNKVVLSIERAVDHVTVNGDKDMMKEVFINLINNGIKYNHEGGKVLVKVQQQDGHAHVDVIDTGIGIPESELCHITEEFYRVKSENRKCGAGLGLAIVKRILDVHGGTLNITSTVDKGSTFRIRLPMKRQK